MRLIHNVLPYSSFTRSLFLAKIKFIHEMLSLISFCGLQWLIWNLHRSCKPCFPRVGRVCLLIIKTLLCINLCFLNEIFRKQDLFLISKASFFLFNSFIVITTVFHLGHQHLTDICIIILHNLNLFDKNRPLIPTTELTY